MSTGRLATVLTLSLALMVAPVFIGCAGPASSTTPSPGTAPNRASTPATGSGGSNSSSQAGHAIVTITDTALVPEEVTVKVGSRVVWQNNGKVAHAIAFDDGSVSSPDIAPGNSASHVFTKAGTFKYHCSQQPTIRGSVIVE